MTQSYTLAKRTNVNTFKDTATVGDVNRYSIDATPWAEDGGAVVSAASSVVNGSASISGETLVAGVWSADVTTLARGQVQIGVLFSCATAKKQTYIDIRVNDNDANTGDDYGQGCC